MSILKVTKNLHTETFSLRVLEDKIIVKPKDKLTPEISATLKQHKQPLIALLEPSRSQDPSAKPQHWSYLPELPAKGEPYDNTKRYTVNLFGTWYLLSFDLDISETTVRVVDTHKKRRMFHDLNEFFRWACAEKLYSDLSFEELINDQP